MWSSPCLIYITSIVMAACSLVCADCQGKASCYDISTPAEASVGLQSPTMLSVLEGEDIPEICVQLVVDVLPLDRDVVVILDTEDITTGQLEMYQVPCMCDPIQYYAYPFIHCSLSGVYACDYAQPGLLVQLVVYRLLWV